MHECDGYGVVWVAASYPGDINFEPCAGCPNCREEGIMFCFFCTHLAEFRGTFQGERVPCCLLCTVEYPVRNVNRICVIEEEKK